MSVIDRTPIYRFFMKNALLWCPVSGIYIPTPFFTGHLRTPHKQNRYKSIKNRTPQKKKNVVNCQFCCPEVSGYD